MRHPSWRWAALCLSAAERLAEFEGGAALIITVFPIPPMNIGETDSPPRAVVLGNVLSRGGYEPILVTDEVCRPIIEEISGELPLELVSRDSTEAEKDAERLLSKYRPKGPSGYRASRLEL